MLLTLKIECSLLQDEGSGKLLLHGYTKFLQSDGQSSHIYLA